jgi:hypothetical protein
MSGADEILAAYENLRPSQEDFYRDLHRHPQQRHPRLCRPRAQHAQLFPP